MNAQIHAIGNIARIIKYGLCVLAKQHKPNWFLSTNIIDLVEDLRISPKQFVDVGAHNSEIALWMVEKWPWIEVISFEPNRVRCPIGKWIQKGLSDERGIRYFTKDPSEQFISEEINGYPFEIVRFDSLEEVIRQPAILKIDAEHYSARAMRGFGERLKEFQVVVIEMANHFPKWHKDYPGEPVIPNQQVEIWQCALAAGLDSARVVAAEFTPNGVPFYDIAFYRCSDDPSLFKDEAEISTTQQFTNAKAYENSIYCH